MSEKVQIGPVISAEAKAMLEQMAASDFRSIGGQVEWLIIRENQRRTSELTDARAEYEVMAK